MIVVEIVVLVAILLTVAALAAGLGDVMTFVHRDIAPVALPADVPVTGPDLERLRFNVVLRGYRMAEVDAVLDRFAADIARRDAEISALQERLDALDDADGTRPLDPHLDPEAVEGPDAQPRRL